MLKSFFSNLFFLSLILLLIVQKPLYPRDLTKYKIAIISLYDQGYKHIGQFSDENKQKYAKKHGYDVFIYHNVLDTARPPAWSKIIAIQRHLKDYKWIYWSDADSLIMNTNIKLESFVNDDVDLIISKECYYGFLNTGSFLIKNTPWSHILLKRIYAQRQFINHLLWEQQALAHLLKIDKTIFPHLKIVDQRVLNSNYGYTSATQCWYKEGDFVVHFFGPCDKAKLMKNWSQSIVY